MNTDEASRKIKTMPPSILIAATTTLAPEVSVRSKFKRLRCPRRSRCHGDKRPRDAHQGSFSPVARASLPTEPILLPAVQPLEDLRLVQGRAVVELRNTVARHNEIKNTRIQTNPQEHVNLLRNRQYSFYLFLTPGGPQGRAYSDVLHRKVRSSRCVVPCHCSRGFTLNRC